MNAMSARPFRIWRVIGTVVLVLVMLVLATFYLARAGIERWVVQRIEAALDATLAPDVRVEGPLVWQVWPQPRLMLDGLSVIDGGKALIRNERLVVEVDVEALRSQLLVVDRVVLERPEIMLGNDPARWLSADAWLVPSRGAASSAPPVVRRIVVHDGRLSLAGPSPVDVDRVMVELEMPLDRSRPGRIVIDAELRAMVQGFSMAGRLSQQGEFEIEDSGVRLRDAALRFEGTADAFDAVELDLVVSELLVADDETRARGLDLAVKMRGAEQAFRHASSAAELVLTGDELIATELTGETAFEDGVNRAVGDIRLRQLRVTARDEIHAELAISLTLAGPLDATGDFDGRIDYAIDDDGAEHVQAKGRLGLRLPPPRADAGEIFTEVDTRIDWWPRASRAQGAVAGRFDDSELAGTWRFDAHDVRPLHVDLRMDRLDLDGYLGNAASDAPPDLAPWRSWPLSAELMIGELRWRGLETTDTRLSINPH